MKCTAELENATWRPMAGQAGWGAFGTGPQRIWVVPDAVTNRRPPSSLTNFVHPEQLASLDRYSCPCYTEFIRRSGNIRPPRGAS